MALPPIFRRISTIKKSVLILILLITSSCKLFEAKDTTDPIVSFAIAGGNEISREVTLYLHIEDDSKIDYADIMIDDTLAVTVKSNFDTISFDVTTFADESEHQLYAKVADSEGNIGESEKIDVVITEFPGWRIYNDFDFGQYAPIAIDENGLIWIGTQSFWTGTNWSDGGLYIFNPSNNEWTHMTIDNSELKTNIIRDIKVISDSRVWISNDTHIIQYDFDLKRWISIIDLPDPDNTWTSVFVLAIDNNYNLWVGADTGIFYYIGNNLIKWYQWPEDIPAPRVWDIICTNDNNIFAGTDYNVFSIKDSIVTEYDFFVLGYFDDFTTLTLDNLNQIWASEEGRRCFLFSNNSWIEAPSSENIMYQPFIISDKSGDYFTQAKYRGLVSGDGINWIYFDEIDSPFKEKYNTGTIRNNQEIYTSYEISREGLSEAPNGDIWMVAGGKLMRYRPSLSVYP